MTCTGSFGKAKGQRLLVAHWLGARPSIIPAQSLVQLAPVAVDTVITVNGIFLLA